MFNLKFCLTLLVFGLLLLSGCSDDGGGNGNGGNGPDGEEDPDGRYFIWANLGPGILLDNFEVAVWPSDSDDVPASECEITINGTNVPLIGTDGIDAYFATTEVGYEASTGYTIVAQIGNKSASCNFTTPSTPAGAEVHITSPDDGSYFEPGDAINLTWTVSGGTPDLVHVAVSADDVDEYIFETELSSSATSYTINGATTSAWAPYYEFLVSVDLGEYAYPFTGELAEVGSFTFIVLGGNAIYMYNEEGGDTTETPGEHAYLDLAAWPMMINADGVSASNIYATVMDENYNYVADGTVVSFTTNRGTISPSSSTTETGAAEVVLTSSITPGTATVIATCGVISDTVEVEFEEVVNVNIAVGSGARPSIYWTPGTETAYGLSVSKINGIHQPRWTVVSAIGFTPPVTYGTLPANSTQAWPLAGGSPADLVEGETYRVGLVTAHDDTTFYTFTR
ncbi:Ig-like domain-containing protein [bacterium]|nr:Ig-like domain-containing protein [bacterium]